MKQNYQRLQAEQLSRRLRGLPRDALRETPGRGWIRAVRDALAMSSYQLAQRVGVSQPEIVHWEQREAKGTISLKSLRRVADALQCDLVYALAPRQPIRKILQQRALEVASTSVEQVSQSMALEDQRTDALRRARIVRETAQRLLDERPRRLWDA
jgi:predicted DNA-binding mobile mystery protein A